MHAVEPEMLQPAMRRGTPPPHVLEPIAETTLDAAWKRIQQRFRERLHMASKTKRRFGKRCE